MLTTMAAKSPAQMAHIMRVRASYDAGANTRRTIGWKAPVSSPNSEVLFNLATLRSRSRKATRNDGYAKGSIDKLVYNTVGTGIKPLSQAPDQELRKDIHALWLAWTDESDADGMLDWYGQQSQGVRAWLEGGEAFLRLRPRRLDDGLSVPLQIEVLEPELVPHDRHRNLPNGNRLRAGIEFNRIGRRVAYWFHQSRPGEDALRGSMAFVGTPLRRVPAQSVVHLYEPLRPGQIRGVPHLTQALIRLHELAKYDDATLLRQQLANMFMAFLKRTHTGEGETLHPLTGLPVDDKSGDNPILTMEPGILQELEPGEEMQFSDPPEVRSGYEAFTRQQLFTIAAATGVPYEILTGDMRGVNDRVVRVILHEFRRSIQARQHQIIAFQLCRPVWEAWLTRAVLAGQLPTEVLEPENRKVKWMPQGWPYLHPVQDVDAQNAAIRSGFTSRSAVVSEQGEDAEEIDREQAQDNERADEFGLRYDSDGRNSKGASMADSDDDEDATPEPEPGESEEDEDEDEAAA